MRYQNSHYSLRTQLLWITMSIITSNLEKQLRDTGQLWYKKILTRKVSKKSVYKFWNHMIFCYDDSSYWAINHPVYTFHALNTPQLSQLFDWLFEPQCLCLMSDPYFTCGFSMQKRITKVFSLLSEKVKVPQERVEMLCWGGWSVNLGRKKKEVMLAL